MDEVEEIEKQKDDSARMYASIRRLQNYSPKEPLLLDTKNGGKTANDEDHVEIITEFFKNLFQDKETEKIKNIPPRPMKKEFTPTEVRTAIKRLKMNKAAGIDEIKAEQLNYGPEAVDIEIAQILNDIAATGAHPKEIK